MIEIELLSPQEVDVDIENGQSLDVNIAEGVIKEGSYIAGDYISIVNNTISVVPTNVVEDGNGGPVSSDAVAKAIAEAIGGALITGVSDEFVISGEQILELNRVPVAKVDGIQALIDESIAGIGVATLSNPGLVLSSLADDGILVGANGAMTVNSLNISKLYQDADTDIVMCGGDSEY